MNRSRRGGARCGSAAIVGWLALAAFFTAADQASAGSGAPLLAQGAAAVPTRSGPGTLPALLADARRLLQRQDPGAAYALLEPVTAAYAGEPEFDYLLGISALDSGRPSQAVIALERLLAHQPDNTLARAEIARAYLALRETDAARREFQSVARSELPPEVRDTVRRYLDILAQPEPGPARRWRASVETAVGYDGNVNVGSSADRWVLGDGQALTPLASSRPQRSVFYEASGQFQYTAPIDGRTDWTIGSNLSQRNHASQHNYDLGSVEVSSGLAQTRGPNRYSTSIQVQQLFLDDRSFRTAAGLLGQWQRELDASTQVGAYAQLFALDFADQSARDARRAVLGGTLARGLNDRARSVVAANLYAGRESSRRGIGELSFDLVGLRAAVSRNLAPGWRASAGVSWEHRDHDAPDGFFGVTRRDRQFEIRLAAERDLGARFTLSPQLVHTRNASSLAPNDFRRTQVVVSARYRF